MSLAFLPMIKKLNFALEKFGLFFREMGPQGGIRKLEPGLLIMFPGYIQHGVQPQEFKGYRYVVSANLSEKL